jgi:hypothetical protein
MREAKTPKGQDAETVSLRDAQIFDQLREARIGMKTIESMIDVDEDH